MKKFYFISIGLILGLMVHAFTSAKLYTSRVSDHQYFSFSMMVTVIYFILAVIGIALLVMVPMELAKKKSASNNESINWWWQIYLAGWVLLILVGLEYLLLDLFSLKIGSRLLEHTMILFIPKGLCLIPAYFVEQKEKTKSIISTLMILELIAFVLLLMLFRMAGQMVPDFGE